MCKTKIILSNNRHSILKYIQKQKKENYWFLDKKDIQEKILECL